MMQRTSSDRKARLYASFAAALDVLDAAGREPDRWEEECLSYALGAMACGMELVAEVELAAFSRPLDERSPDALVALAAKPRRFTTDMLRHGLEYVKDRSEPPEARTATLPPALAASQLDFETFMRLQTR